MKYLVTGAGGMIGGALVEHLARRGDAVTAWARRPSSRLESVSGPVTIRRVDLLDADAVRAGVAEADADVIFHFAAQSLPSISWEDPAGTFAINVTASIQLFEIVRQLQRNPLIIVASSSSIYACDPSGKPIPEDAPQNPVTPYALTKMTLDHAALVYGRHWNMRIIRARPFFVIGPGRPGDVSSDFAYGVVAIERGRQESLSVGNLDAVRDFMDIDDALTAFDVLVEKGQAGEAYNICSGRGYAIAELLDGFKKFAATPVTVVRDEQRMRPLDEPVKIGDPSKLRGLGWKPQHDLNYSLERILNYCRAQES